MKRALLLSVIVLGGCRGARHVVLDDHDAGPPMQVATCDEAFDECMPCPEDLVHREINGCLDCECVPPSQCTTDDECGSPMEALCEPGLLCWCEGPGCCVSTCRPVECTAPDPAPEGCSFGCMEPDCPSATCRYHDCRCVGDRWICDASCTEHSTESCDL